MKGPFFAERDIVLSSDFPVAVLDTTDLLCARPGVSLYCRTALLGAALDDEDISALIVTGLVATCRLTPWGNRVTSTRGLAFTAAVRVIDRVHRDTAVGGTNASPAIASGFAGAGVLVVRVANLADGRHALDKHSAGLARGQLEQCIV